MINLPKTSVSFVRYFRSLCSACNCIDVCWTFPKRIVDEGLRRI